LRSVSKIVVLLLFCVYGYSQDSSEVVKNHHPDSIISDIHYLVDKIERIHPNLYYSLPKEQFKKQIDSLIQSIDSPISSNELWRALTPIICSLNDGHTAIFFSNKERKKYLDAGNKLLPVKIIIHEDQLFVKQNFTENRLLEKETEIISINGIPSNEIIQNLIKYRSGEREEFRKAYMEKNFDQFLWAVYGFGNKYDFVLQSPDDTNNISLAIDGISLETKIEKNQKKPPFSFTYIDSIKTGIIDFRSFRNPDLFESFLDSAILILNAKNAKFLIVDMSHNGGGNSQLGDILISKISDNPYSQISQMDIKVSKEIRKLYRNYIFNWYSYPFYPFIYFTKARKIVSGKTGMIASFPRKEKLPANNNPDCFFNGKTYFITGPYTFSSATMLAATIKCYEMATIVGEPTGGFAQSYGDLYPIKLPYSKLPCAVSHKQFYPPCSEDFGFAPIEPDILLEKTLEDKLDDSIYFEKLIKIILDDL